MNTQKDQYFKSDLNSSNMQIRTQQFMNLRSQQLPKTHTNCDYQEFNLYWSNTK